MSLHFLPSSTPALGTFPAWKPVSRGRRDTMLLVGFIAGEGSGAALSRQFGWVARSVVQVEDPFTALGMLLDDPGDFGACILDARIFEDEEALWDVLRLISFEQGDCSVIVVHLADPERFAMTDRHRETLHLALGDPSEPAAARLIAEHCRTASGQRVLS